MDNNTNHSIRQDTFITKGQIEIKRQAFAVDYNAGVNHLFTQLDTQLGVVLESSFEYPGKYTRYNIGFVNPMLQLVANYNKFSLKALNQRGQIILGFITAAIQQIDCVKTIATSDELFEGSIIYSTETFTEEMRSKQPSIFMVIRAITDVFYTTDDANLGLYGAFGYDLAFQFEHIKLKRERPSNQRDLVLYFPDQLIIVDHRKEVATQYEYDFSHNGQTTVNLPRDGKSEAFIPNTTEGKSSEYKPGGYAAIVKEAIEYFKRGDLFEVVPGQTFYNGCKINPSVIFDRLRKRNQSPYSFFMNLGQQEYLIGSSPEMYIRVTKNKVESSPISGTIKRGSNAIEDAANILQLLNSVKDESELTMCTDVDRNDKSRICKPGSINVISNRKLEVYSRLIHTVDHVVGELREGYDSLDAFLSHTWAVTVTGAPKAWAMQFIEDHEISNRNWYGGAVGYIGFNKDMNTGLTIRTVRIKDGISSVRVGATLLYDSIPEEEEKETILKASALIDALNNGTDDKAKTTNTQNYYNANWAHKKVLLVDHQDSFVNTLANYFRQFGVEVITLRSGFKQEILAKLNPDLVVLSPGPGRPCDFAVSQTIAMCVKLAIPVFGVCLGLQGLVEYCGGSLDLLEYPLHGKKVILTNYHGKIFDGIKSKEIKVGLYHSLYANKDDFPEQLNVCAESSQGIIMAIEHKTLPMWAVQFHPESILSLTDNVGLTIINNVLKYILR
ncbi:MAG: Anthranilate synthase [Pseudomonadota bacterium]|jgi:anthranilate synthase